MHEIGHIYLGHLFEFDETIMRRSKLTKEKYKVLENEANFFARNTLAPVLVVQELGLNTAKDLVSFFGISLSAADVRLQTLRKDYQYLYNPQISILKGLFWKLFFDNSNTITCPTCGHYFIGDNELFCPICGGNDLIKTLMKARGIKKVKYSGYATDAYGRAHKCPKCDNEELDYEGLHCKICGTIVVNKCASREVWNGHITWNCDTVLEGNARYCTNCGFQSTFYEQGLLKNWEAEKEEHEMNELLTF